MAKVEIRTSPNLDILCLMNVLTGDPWYVSCHEQAFQRFGKTLSLASRLCLKIVTTGIHSKAISPWATWTISALPDFESGKMSDLLQDTNTL